jgi:glutaredoxin
MYHLTLYSKRDCHLCDRMKAVLREVAERLPLAVDEVDITTDPELERRYGRDIPVLAVGSRELARHRVDAATLLRRLEKT